jgi:catalase
VRGFAVKFYTEEGNLDLVGNNIPVFFIQDAIKFPDLVHSVKMEADRGFPQAASAHDTFWDFASLMPETMHMLTWAMSDRAIPRSFRMMEGFGVHTFRLVDAAGKSSFVKFHWRPTIGSQSVLWNDAVKSSGADPDFHRRDLWQAIDSGNFPEYELGLQVFDEAFAEKFEFDVLDATKLIPEELSRLGSANFHEIPINRPVCPLRNFQRDGQMRMAVPKGRVNYEPSSLDRRRRARSGRAVSSATPRRSPVRRYGNAPRRSLTTTARRASSFAHRAGGIKNAAGTLLAGDPPVVSAGPCWPAAADPLST